MEGENPERREDEMERRTGRAGGECVGVGSSRGEIPGSWAGLGHWQRFFWGARRQSSFRKLGQTSEPREAGGLGGVRRQG